MAGRFIKLYDKILNWEWYHDTNTFRLFIHLLLKANYKDGTFQGIPILRGQLVTSLTSISAGTGLTIRQARDSLDKLKMTGEVTSKPYPKFRVITIVRYDEYQSNDKQDDKQMTGKTAGKRQANDKQTDKQNGSQTSREMTTSIEYIELQNDRNIESPTEIERKTASRFTPPTREEIQQFCDENGMQIDVNRFIDYYTANGWMVGKNKMKDWKATVRNWYHRDLKEQKQEPVRYKRALPADNFEQRDYSDVPADDMAKLAAEIKDAREAGII